MQQLVIEPGCLLQLRCAARAQVTIMACERSRFVDMGMIRVNARPLNHFWTGFFLPVCEWLNLSSSTCCGTQYVSLSSTFRAFAVAMFLEEFAQWQQGGSFWSL